MCVGGFRGHISSNRIELSQFVQDLLHFFWFGFPWLLGVGQLGEAIWGDYLQSIWVQECSEVKNLQTELNYLDYFRTYWIFVFWAPYGSWGGGRWVGASEGMDRCHHTCADAHIHMYRNCKWPISWRHPCLSCLTCMHVRACVCMHVHICMGCPHTLTSTPTPIHPPLPHSNHPYPNPPVSQRGPLESVKIQ